MRLGVDLGGTKIAAVVLDDAGRVVWEERVATPRDDYDATIEAIAGIVGAGDRAVGSACTVGIGTPGATSPATGLIKNANSTWLIGRPLHADLERRLARPVRLANDANCLAVSEATDGAALGRADEREGPGEVGRQRCGNEPEEAGAAWASRAEPSGDRQQDER